MRDLTHLEYRRMPDLEKQLYGSSMCGDKTHGIFMLKSPTGRRLYCIASDGRGWEHVSVSIPGEPHCPSWEDMAYVKDQFWLPVECAVQFHPPKDKYVNTHPYVLHIWRPLECEIPVPGRELVGL